jgi:hypothetical protein
MGNNVFANGREVSCKAADGKSICAFPDVCFTPPQTPATPPGVPIPYPNTAMASDTTDGSKNVRISGKEVMLKNKSYFKKSTGDEAGCAPLKGVLTHKNMGKVYFNSWSMDVVFEAENVVRHLDLTTHNHYCSPSPPNSPPWVHIAMMYFTVGGICEGMDYLTLVPYKDGCPEKNQRKQTGHHLIPDRCATGKPGYSHGAAPCICVLGKNQHTGSHRACHRRFDPVERFHSDKGIPFDYNTARTAAAESAGGAIDPPRDLNDKEKRCVLAQLDAYYMKDPEGPRLEPSTTLNKQGAPGKVNVDYDQFVSDMQTIGY